MKTLPLQSLACKTETRMCWMWANILFDSCPLANVFQRWRRCSPTSGCCENTGTMCQFPRAGVGCGGVSESTTVWGEQYNNNSCLWSRPGSDRVNNLNANWRWHWLCQWKQWQRDRRALCLLVPAATPSLQTSNGEGHRAAWCGAHNNSTTRTQSCLLHTHPVHPPNTHTCSGLSRWGENSTENTWSSDTVCAARLQWARPSAATSGSM